MPSTDPRARINPRLARDECVYVFLFLFFVLQRIGIISVLRLNYGIGNTAIHSNTRHT